MIELWSEYECEEIELKTLFPACEGRVFAYWFSGVIELVNGEPVMTSEFSEMCIDVSTYEYYHRLTFEKGMLIAAEYVSTETVIADR